MSLNVRLGILATVAIMAAENCLAGSGMTFTQQIASDMGIAISSDKVCGTDYAAEELANKYPDVKISKSEVGMSILVAESFLKSHGKDDFCLTAKALMRKALGHDPR